MTPDSPLERRRDAALAGFAGDERTARAALADPDAGVRSAALQALARMGRLLDDDVATSVADPAADVRRRAAEVGVATGVDLVPLLADDDHLVVEAACWALGERGADAGDEAIAALAAVVTGHDDPLCREAAVAALGAIGDESALPAVLAATRDRPAVRRRAVLALAPFVGPEVDAALDRALTDRDWQVRQAAEDLTGRTGEP